MQKINVEILLLVNSISPKNALYLPKTRKDQKNSLWEAQTAAWKDFAADFKVSKVCHQIAP